MGGTFLGVLPLGLIQSCPLVCLLGAPHIQQSFLPFGSFYSQLKLQLLGVSHWIPRRLFKFNTNGPSPPFR